MKKTQTIEIARSFSKKKNLGNYETADFFCSAKTEATPAQFTKVSAELYDLCRKEVEKDFENFEVQTLHDLQPEYVDQKRENFLKVGQKWQSKEEAKVTDTLGEQIIEENKPF
jgi:hypothetical protein